MVRSKLLFIVAAVVIVLVIVMNYGTRSTPVADSATETRTQTVPIVYEEDIPSNALPEVKSAIMYFPPAVTDAFINGGWKIVLVKDVPGDDDIYPMSAIGETDFDAHTITIQTEDTAAVSDIVLARTLHEIGHFADRYYGGLSTTEEWESLFSGNQDYVEFDYAGILVTDSNRGAVGYAVSDAKEMFACVLKDYYLHPDYLIDNFSELYAYCEANIK